ncbi:hypothetical protein RIF29_06405 [Crotalaria pallida]|uniref:Uncharacterized protein n=1 Tax=Crotalaria pallida TaxID=3830 RepID=A0AAN9J4P1_CROPI
MNVQFDFLTFLHSKITYLGFLTFTFSSLLIYFQLLSQISRVPFFHCFKLQNGGSGGGDSLHAMQAVDFRRKI